MRLKVLFMFVALAAIAFTNESALAATTPADAPLFDAKTTSSLEGRTVLLLVGSPEATREQKAHYFDLLKRSGASLKPYPVFATTSLPESVASRLGVAGREPGYAALVRWGNPGRFGPSAVLDPGIITDLTSDADLYVLVSKAIVLNGQSALLDRLSEDMKHLIPHANLVIDQTDFQANGTPHFVLATKARISNTGKVNATGVTVIFLVADPKSGGWFELGRQANIEIKAGQAITRDLVRKTFDTPLLNDKNEVQPARYEIRVEMGADVVEATGEFSPLEIEDQDQGKTDF